MNSFFKKNLLLFILIISFQLNNQVIEEKKNQSNKNLISTPLMHGDGQIDVESIYHFTRDEYYRSPGWATTEGSNKSGAVALDTDVSVKLKTKKNDVDSVSVVLQGTYPEFEKTFPMNIFDTKDGYDYWEGVIESPEEPNECSYYFKIQDGSTIRYYMDNPDDYDGGFGEVKANTQWVAFPLIYYPQNFSTPKWHRNVTLGYQIFIDRFFNGDVSNDAEGNGTSGDILWWEWDFNGNGRRDTDDGQRIYATQKEWSNTDPDLYDFYGGDLQGILEKIDYLKNLGVDMLYLNPFTESPDNHGYSIVDYYAIDPYYGKIQDRDQGVVLNDKEWGLEFFQNFTESLEENGIKLIYDIVINHCSAQSPYFQRFEHLGIDDNATGFGVEDQFPEVLGAYESNLSEYYNWFEFYEYNHNYGRFDGQYDTIPTFEYSQTDEIEKELITGPNSIFSYWSNLGVDGFRLDVSQDYDDGQGARYVNRIIREKVKSDNPELPIIGEVWDTAQAPRFLTGIMNDGVQNMAFIDKTRSFVYERLSEGNYRNFMLSQQETYPPMAFNSFWTLLGNHDTTRILTHVFGKPEILKMAVMLQMTYPGVPMVYYGDEVGLLGGRDPDCRKPFPWGSENTNIQTFYQDLTQLRKNKDILRNGGFEILDDDVSNVLCYTRHSLPIDEEFAVIIVNKNNEEKKVTIDIESFRSASKGDIFTNMLDSEDIYEINSRGALKLTIPASGSMILFGSVIPSEKKTVNSYPILLLISFLSLSVLFIYETKKMKKA